MLKKDFTLLLSEHGGELVLIGAFLVGISDLRLFASFFKEIMTRDFLSSKFHAEGWADLTEGDGAHLDSCLSDVVTLKMSELDGILLTTACEHHHSLKLLNVGLFQLLVVEEIYPKYNRQN